MTQLLQNNLMFTDEQAMLLDMAATFFSEKSISDPVRTTLTSEPGFDLAHWDAIVELGWPGLAIPQQYGGSGLDLGLAASIAEPMGRHLFSLPFIAVQLFIQGLLAGGNSEQQAAYLPAIAAGCIATVALFEQQGQWQLADISCSANKEGDSVILRGEKTFVTYAHVADIFLVSVLYQGQPALAIVSSDSIPANAMNRETVIDETQRSYRIKLDGIHINPSQLIVGQQAIHSLTRIHHAALLLVSATAVGGAAGVLNLMVEYLNTRVAFGRKIGSYQALKHPCADIVIDLERARSHLYHGASVVDNTQSAEIALRMAKAASCDLLAYAADRAIQFHGGMGFTYECDAQLYLRRALWLQYMFGDSEYHRGRLAQLLL